MPDVPYRRVQVIVNPASGKNEPILNVLDDVFHTYGVDWDARVTHAYGDAGRLTRAAVDDGVDLVAGYGGDGTQHEVANALVQAARETGRLVPLGILPGGTGNGFSREVGTPRTLREATELLCISHRHPARRRGPGHGERRWHDPRGAVHPAGVPGHGARATDEPGGEGSLRRPRLPRVAHQATRRRG